VRRLFSTFAHGSAGVGLLLLRLGAGIALAVHEASPLWAGPSIGAAILHGLSLAMGILLIAGLWTPIAGALVAIIAPWNAFSHSGDPWIWIMLGIVGAALALLGPGAWSVDARLFGWKRLEFRDRKNQDAS